MDGDTVTEEDLGGGFLFREEDGAVGKNVSGLPRLGLTSADRSRPSSNRLSQSSRLTNRPSDLGPVPGRR